MRTQKVTVELILEIKEGEDADDVVSCMDYEVNHEAITYSEIRGIQSVISPDGEEEVY